MGIPLLPTGAAPNSTAAASADEGGKPAKGKAAKAAADARGE